MGIATGLGCVTSESRRSQAPGGMQAPRTERAHFSQEPGPPAHLNEARALYHQASQTPRPPAGNPTPVDFISLYWAAGSHSNARLAEKTLGSTISSGSRAAPSTTEGRQKQLKAAVCPWSCQRAPGLPSRPWAHLPPAESQQCQPQGYHPLQEPPFLAGHSQTWQEQLTKHPAETSPHGDDQAVGRVTQLQPWRGSTSRGKIRRKKGGRRERGGGWSGEGRTGSQQLRAGGLFKWGACQLQPLKSKSTLQTYRIPQGRCWQESTFPLSAGLKKTPVTLKS